MTHWAMASETLLSQSTVSRSVSHPESKSRQGGKEETPPGRAKSIAPKTFSETTYTFDFCGAWGLFRWF